MLILALAALGVLGIIAGVIAARTGATRADEAPAGTFARHLRIARRLGYLLAVASWPLTGLMAYPYADNHGRAGRVAGLPFFVAYFDAQGHDYVGLLSMVGLVGNAAFWCLLPRLAIVLRDQWSLRAAADGPPAES